jgi:hypothetical protein
LSKARVDEAVTYPQARLDGASISSLKRDLVYREELYVVETVKEPLAQ